jgi:hypothetical protein
MKFNYGDIAAQKVSERIAAACADTDAIKAIPEDRRLDGMVVVNLDDYSVWLFEAGSAAAASSTVLEPDVGDGRWTTVGITSGVRGVVTVSKTVLFSDLTDADMQQTIDFDAALPAGAAVLGAGANVTAIFDNVTDNASVTFDLGIKSGDTDGFVDGGSLNAVAKVGVPAGVVLGALVGAITPSIIFDGSVNLNTLTKGAATFYVSYVLMF